MNGVNFGAKPKHPDRYPAVSSELWFEFAEQLPEITINRIWNTEPNCFRNSAPVNGQSTTETYAKCNGRKTTKQRIRLVAPI